MTGERGDEAFAAPPVDVPRLLGELERLASFSDAPAPAVTRILYTPSDRAARAYLIERFEAAGLAVRTDPLGTTFARWEGREPELAPVATGSHADAIPHSGRYDGTVGVLGALEAVRALQRSGVRPRRPIELILFTAEEPTRFGIGCLGSRAMAGLLTSGELRTLRDEAGVSLEEARREAGFDGDLDDVRLPEGAYRTFLELHIEQGPILEQRGIPVAAVTAIAAPATLEVTLDGEGGHAGAVLMPARRDALAAAAEAVLEVERAARQQGGEDTVATVGRLEVHPGAVNAIPARARFSVDCRDVDGARRDRVLETIRGACRAVAERRGVRCRIEVVNADPPAECDPEVIAAVEASARGAGMASARLVSRAYHDALFMARLCPTGMLFVPCRDGVSHRPDEHVEPQWLESGVRVLAGTLLRLADG